jgi:hypothetical protein
MMRSVMARSQASVPGFRGRRKSGEGAFYAKMFHVKHRGLKKSVSRETVRRRPENTILQNNPMHQKISLVFQ